MKFYFGRGIVAFMIAMTISLMVNASNFEIAVLWMLSVIVMKVIDIEV